MGHTFCGDSSRGIPEQIADEETYFLISPGDAQAMAAQIE
jgi:hypothetical protein